MRIVDTQALDRFMAEYEPALYNAVRKHPEEYGFPLESVPIVAARMRTAFERGSYNHEGSGIKAACKALGIKHTRKAIEGFLTTGVQS